MEPADRDDHLHPRTPPPPRPGRQGPHRAGHLPGRRSFAFLAAQAAVLAAHAASRHITTGWNWPQLAGFVAFILFTEATGSAFGAMLHNTAVAIVTYFAPGGAFSLLMIRTCSWSPVIFATALGYLAP